MKGGRDGGTRQNRAGSTDPWPALPFEAWRETAETLHLWLQVVGKIRLSHSPWINHQWHATLLPTARGLTTLEIPRGRPGVLPGRGRAPSVSSGRPVSPGGFQLDVDFIDHVVRISTSEGGRAEVEMRPRSVAEFHGALLGKLAGLGVTVTIHGAPNELPDPVPFAQDHAPRAYDPEAAHRYFRALSSSARVLGEFRARFTGKSSPVHLFWGAMDLAVTRFSGRKAPPHPGGIPNLPDWITREAYSHEVSSAGFWPGSAAYPEPIYYAYASPTPEGYPAHPVRPTAARWESELSEFVLPYEAVRTAASPEDELLSFLESTYAMAADLAAWDREALEWGPGEQPRGRGWTPATDPGEPADP